MSFVSSKIIPYARFYLGSTFYTSNDSDIGLYNDTDGGSQSVLRWIVSDISIYLPLYSWKVGVLYKDNPFGVLTDSLSLPFDGGDTINNSGASVIAANSIDIGGVISNLYQFLDDNGISLIKTQCEIGYFQITAGSLVLNDGYTLFKGGVEDLENDVRKLMIIVEDRTIDRSINMGSTIDKENYSNPPNVNIGNNINVVLGTFYNEYDSIGNLVWGGAARALKTEELDKNLVIGYNVQVADDLFLSLNYLYDKGIEVFYPVFSGNPNLGKLGGGVVYLGAGEFTWTDDNGVVLTSGTHYLDYLENGILEIVSGQGSGQGAVIKNAYVNLSLSSNEIIVSLDNFFITEPKINDYTNPTQDDSWVRLKFVNNKYVLDEWPLKSFIDNNLNDISRNFFVYSYGKKSKLDTETNEVNETDSQFISVPSYNINTNSDNNELTTSAQTTESNIITSEKYFYEYPKFTEYNTPDWNTNPNTGAPNHGKLADRMGIPLLKQGRYLGFGGYETSSNDGTTLTVNPSGFAPMYDGDGNTSFYYTVSLPAGGVSISNVIFCFALELPEIINQSEFNLACKIIISTNNASVAFRTKLRTIRYVGNAEESIDKELLNISDSWDGLINTLPDNFYSANPTDIFDLYFYKNEENYNYYTTYRVSSGVNLFKMESLSGDSNYKNHKFVYLFFETGMSKELVGSPASVTVNIHNLAFAYKKSTNLKKELFTYVKGRKFADDWNGRKIDNDQIETPTDMIEHLKRLGNWTEYGATNEFGKEYAPEALIDTGLNRGSYDSNDLDYLSLYRPSLQIDGQLNSIVRILCNDYWLYSFIDSASGAEQLLPVFRRDTVAPTITITYDQIIGDVKPIKVPSSKKIFCQPELKYAWNNATKSYDKNIKITNVNKTTFDSSYVLGVFGSDAEIFWNMGKLLFSKYKTIEEPPKRLIEKRSIVRDNEAIDCLYTWFEVMGISNTNGSVSGLKFDPRLILGFTIPLILGINLFKGNHFNLILKHQTKNLSVECRILSIEKNLNSDICNLTIMMFGFTDVVQFYVQDTVDNTNPDWVETLDLQIVHGEGEDIEEVV